MSDPILDPYDLSQRQPQSLYVARKNISLTPVLGVILILLLTSVISHYVVKAVNVARKAGYQQGYREAKQFYGHIVEQEDGK